MSQQLNFQSKLYNRLKLEKIVTGPEQRIFKTNTQAWVDIPGDRTPLDTKLDFPLIDGVKTITPKHNDVYFAEYNSTKVIDLKTKNSENNKNIMVSGNLINFHDINVDYIVNQPGKYSHLTIDGTNSPWFPINTTIAEENKIKNADERIMYFPSYINTPIDIVFCNNNSYFLLPLSTEKYTNILQSNGLLNNYKQGMYNADLKHNYQNMLSTVIEQSYESPEDTSIPVYDLNFSYLDSLNFGNTDALNAFLTRWNLNTCQVKIDGETVPITSKIVLNSETGEIGTENADSILMKPLFKLFVNNTEQNLSLNAFEQKEFFNDLISNLDVFSSNRYLTPIGNITELHENIITSFIADEKNCFKNELIFDINECFIPHNIHTHTKSILPQNVVLNFDTRTALLKHNSLKNDEKWYTKRSVPSAFCNIFFLKNNRSPQYNIDYVISADITAMEEFTISSENHTPVLSFNPNGISAHDNAKERNKLFDFDLTHSYEINHNNEFSFTGPSLNKNVTKDLISYAINADNEISENDLSYTNNYPSRMFFKSKDYLEPYKNYHIAHNKLYNIGKLYGLRNYLKIGMMQGFDNLWFSYNYKTIYDRFLIDELSVSNDFKFMPITIDRLASHWIFDQYNNKLLTYVMKTAKTRCPWALPEDFSNSDRITSIQKLLECKCPADKECKGFCTFPANNALNIPSGILWNTPEESFKAISGIEVDSLFFAESDIQVSDDLEIYIVSGITSEILTEIENADKTISTISSVFSAIFGGFGGAIQKAWFPEYLAVNNIATKVGEKYYINGVEISKYTPFNGPHTIKAGTQLCGFNWHTKEITNKIPAGYSVILKVRSWWSNKITCTGSIKISPVESTNYLSDTMPGNLQNVLKITSKFDFVERNFGFFKYRQEGTHKSNIYSVKLTNSGLNPENDEFYNYKTEAELIQYFHEKYGVWFDVATRTFFEVSFTSKLPTDAETLNNSILSTTLTFNLCQKTNVIDFDTFINLKGWSFIEQNNKILYFNIKEKAEIDNKNNIRKNLRTVLETAIKEKIHTYMPAETQLWKIIYTGK
jgi:hypothetical protein